MTPRLDVKLLGTVTFLRDGQPVTSMPTRAAQALLIYMLHQPHPVERERLMDMFYQETTKNRGQIPSEFPSKKKFSANFVT